MTGPITPHVTMTAVPDGIQLTVKSCTICLPATMARQIGLNLLNLAESHDPLGVPDLPVVTPAGKPIT